MSRPLTEEPSPFAASLLFSYVASFLMTAMRRSLSGARAGTRCRPGAAARADGDAELRELLDAEAVKRSSVSCSGSIRSSTHAPADAVHDMLLALGDLSEQDIAARTSTPEARGAGNVLVRATRGRHPCRRAGRVAVEDAARFRDALGIPLRRASPGRCWFRSAIRLAIRTAVCAHAFAVYRRGFRCRVRVSADAANAISFG